MNENSSYHENSSGEEKDVDDTGRRGLLGRLAHKLTGFGDRREQKRSAEYESHSFTLKVGDETQVARVDITGQRAKIDEELLHPEPGVVVVVTRPALSGEPVSHVFRVISGNEEQPSWICDAVSRTDTGYRARRLEDPMSDYRLAQNPDEKGLGLFADITLPAGTQVLATHRAEIAEIQEVVEGTRQSSKAATLQESYQGIIDAALASD